MLVFRGVFCEDKISVPWKFPNKQQWHLRGFLHQAFWGGPKVWLFLFHFSYFFFSVARHDYQSQHFSKLDLLERVKIAPIVEGCWCFFCIDFFLRGFLHQSQGIIKENHKWHNSDSDIRFTTQFLGNFSDWKLWMISDQDLTTPCSLFERFGVFLLHCKLNLMWNMWV